jgi:hypothetical protein
MSNSLAIAATTATLRNLLHTNLPVMDPHLGEIDVTTQPPDLARKNATNLQLNLFLYQAVANAAWRNHDLPQQVRPGETGTPPLALTLHYLITAYGRGDTDNDSASHRVLGSAMGLLNDHPLLGSAEIAAAMVGTDLGNQIERVRITLQPMGIDEMSKLWTMFQSQYRISAAYEVGVVLIDSRRPVKAPLPVLNRGAGDRGPIAVAGLAPALSAFRLPNSQSALRLGESFAVTGDNIVADADVKAVVSSALLDSDIELPVAPGAVPGEVVVQVEDVAADASALARWCPGYYLVVLVQSRPDVPPVSSNALPLAIAPRIAVAPANAPAGKIDLTLTCEPRIREGQKVLLIFGDRQVKPVTVTTPAEEDKPTTLSFTVPDVVNGQYVVRLRVDGVDSIPVVYAGDPKIAAFDPAQTVTVP